MAEAQDAKEHVAATKLLQSRAAALKDVEPVVHAGMNELAWKAALDEQVDEL